MRNISTRRINNVFKTVAKIHNHIKEVRNSLGLIIGNLQSEADNHDDSKFTREELAYYSAYENFKQGLEFGSEEYLAEEKRLNVGVGSPGFDLHCKRNDHHPEYYDCPEQGVDLGMMGFLPIIKMVCDWHGAMKSYGNKQDWMESVAYNISRFKFNDNQIWLIRQVAAWLHHKDTCLEEIEKES